MKILLQGYTGVFGVAIAAFPLLVFAQEADSMGGMEPLVNMAFWIAAAAFLVAVAATYLAVRQFGTSSLASIFSYLLIGTGIFFFITVFQLLGTSFFGIADPSMDVWWHIMFYMAFAYYFYGLKLLIGLGSADQVVKVGQEKKWGLFALVVLSIIFVFAKQLDGVISGYTMSALYPMGVHHFVAFALAGVVGTYLMSAKKRIGMIGRSIADPMIVTVWALAFIHAWELLNESWKVIVVAPEVGEGVEKIFFIIAASSLTYAAWRLKSTSQA